jgi:hypothetical protein
MIVSDNTEFSLINQKTIFFCTVLLSIPKHTSNIKGFGGHQNLCVCVCVCMCVWGGGGGGGVLKKSDTKA